MAFREPLQLLEHLRCNKNNMIVLPHSHRHTRPKSRMRALSKVAGAVGKLARRAGGTAQPPKRRAVQIAILAVLVLTLCAGDRGLFRLAGLAMDRMSLSSEIRRLEDRQAQLKDEIRRYSGDSDTIERAARERLDLIRRGETVYKFPPGE